MPANAATLPLNAAATDAATPSLVDREMVKWHFICGFAFFLISIFAGMFYALQLSRMYPFPGIELLSPGRLRMIHTNAVAYGFLINLFIGVLYWVVPRLTGFPVLSRALTRVIFFAWQGVVLATALGILTGHAQGIEWGETPTFVDPFAVVGILALVVNVATPLLKTRGRKAYVALWYFAAMLVWTPLVYVMGNFLPQYFVPGAGGAALTGMYIHDLVGLSVTPLGWGMTYYFVPLLLEKPIWSHTLSILGFWGLAFFYPLTGIHHFYYSPIPMYAQYGAMMSTIAIEVVVFTVIVNFFMTLRGRGDRLRTNLPLRWFFVGMLLYMTTCLQCAFQTTLPFQRIIHFTDWVVGHAHLVMFGVFGFWVIGGLVYLWPKLVGREWWNPALNSWNFWLSTLGLTVMFLDLTGAGVVEGFLWRDMAQWEKSIIAVMPFWHLRTISGLMIIAGQLLQAYNMWLTARAPSPSAEAQILPAVAS
jgi:cytochrome c oxidase cbb3-type subunit 1